MMVIAMSRTEIDRMSVSQDLAAGRIKATEGRGRFFTPNHDRPRRSVISQFARLVGPVEMDTIYSLRDRGGCHARSTKRH